MRSELGRLVRRRFSQLMQERLPFFQRIKSREIAAIDSRSNAVYRWDLAENFYGFIILEINRSTDAFTIELAWSNQPDHWCSHHHWRNESAQPLYCHHVQLSELSKQRIDEQWALPVAREQINSKRSSIEQWCKKNSAAPLAARIEFIKQQVEFDIRHWYARQAEPIGQRELQAFEGFVLEAMEMIGEVGLPYFLNAARARGHIVNQIKITEPMALPCRQAS